MSRRSKNFIFINEGIKPGFYIESRYTYLSKRGLEFTEWFLDTSLHRVCETKNNDIINKAINDAYNSTKEIDKITKLKHEYRIIEITKENDPLKELVELSKKYEEQEK